MDSKPKSKKSTGHVHDPDTPDSLVSALTNEVLAPENFNLVIPITMFTVQSPFSHADVDRRGLFLEQLGGVYGSFGIKSMKDGLG
jgi:hypothetical protein